jgi:signal transduction histidine kinase
MGRTRSLTTYSASAAITIAATVARYAMLPFLGYRFALLTYWPAVEIIAYFFGFRPALVSIGLSLILGRLFFMRPLQPLLFPPPDEVVAGCLFVLFSASLSMFMESLRAARQEAEANASLAQERLEQLKREMTLRQRERNWAESVLASIDQGVVASDDEGEVTYINKVAEGLTGWTGAEAVRQPLARVFYTIDQPTGPVLSSTDGRMIPIELSRCVIVDSHDNELGKVIVFRDISGRRKAEDALAASETRLHASLLAAGAAAWEWRIPSDEIVCSHEFRQITGIGDAHPFLSFPVFLELVHEKDRDKLQQELASASARGGEFHVEFRISREPEFRWLALTGRLAVAGRMVGIVVDVTDRRRLEEKLRNTAKQESLGVLSAGIAHDFNNLLTSILGYSSLLKSDLPPASPLAEYATSIEEAGRRAAHLTRQILAYSGQGRVSLELVDITRRVHKVIENLQHTVEPGVTLELELDPDLPGVKADPNQVDQVLSGILLNAIEALRQDKGRVRVATFYKGIENGVEVEALEAQDVPPGRYAVYEVRDNGSGMDEATKSRIFDPFFTTKFTGRGLGLAAVLGIMRGHGGAIHVESTLGVGSIFQIFWPVVSGKVSRGRGIHISE